MAHYGQRISLKKPDLDWEEEEDEYVNVYEQSSLYEFQNQIIKYTGDEHIFFNNYNYYTMKGRHSIWNNGKKDIKIPIADKIIKGRMPFATRYFLAVPSMNPPTYLSSSITIRPYAPSQLSREEMIDSCKDAILSEAGLTDNDLYDIKWEVNQFKSKVTGETTLEVSAIITYYDKIEMNSPMTLSGGDELEGYKGIKNSPISEKDVLETVSNWQRTNKLAPFYGINFVRDFARYKAGDCTQNIICLFREESGEGGVFDFKQRLQKGYLYKLDGVLYNRNELGNYWWGYAAKTIGFSISEMEYGADSYAKSNGVKDEYWEKNAYKKGAKRK